MRGISVNLFEKINNCGGWVVFAISLITYWLSIEPTASLWDCGEYISQASMLEVGHPPGNPIFMLAGRFFCNFAGDDVASYALMVNAMSGLMSALTIMLLFWTVTLMVRGMLCRETGGYSLPHTIVVMASGLVGALAYAWSDTFWYSAVEAEVYSFSSFCTALVLWLTLKWARRSEEPHADRYIVLIAYIIGVSVAVHLLNLLCIPAIALIVAYKRYRHLSPWQLAGVILLSFISVGVILFGLVPGFVKVAQVVELLSVNELSLPFNSGAIIYVVLMSLLLIWTLAEYHIQRSPLRMRISLILTIMLSGMLWIGDNVWLWLVLNLSVAFYIMYSRRMPVRVYSLVAWSVAMIFIGISSYALILIRANANPPMNQNAVDNLFALSSYMNREQYKQHPLLYGPTPFSEHLSMERADVDTLTDKVNYYYEGMAKKRGAARYLKGEGGAMPKFASGFATREDSIYNSRLIARGGDCYLFGDYDFEYISTPELNMVLPRIFSSKHIDQYEGWTGMTPQNMDSVEVSDAINADGDYVVRVNSLTGEREARRLPRPTMMQNLTFLTGYQIGYMYLRYFMWNFVGRQNDLQSQGQADAGNFITGISMLDNAMLGNQSLLPDDIGRGNKGRNLYYFLPVILGLIGLIGWMRGGISARRSSMIVLTLFIMTGLAIVVYLNQTPGEPRERDYAFAGSFYAFAIWIGMGVPVVYKYLMKWLQRVSVSPLAVSSAVAVVTLAVPLQMLSQTYDDHDRSGRRVARDYAINYLESLEPNAILFCNGDNFTFPLWYVQEVEGVRRDVRVINLAYLTTEWYVKQLMQEAYDAEAVPMMAGVSDIAMRRRAVSYMFDCDATPIDALTSLREIYSDSATHNRRHQPQVLHPVINIPIDRKAVVDAGLVSPCDTAALPKVLQIDMREILSGRKSYIRLDELLVLDIVATNAAQGWKRPIYWLDMCQGKELLGFTPYLRVEGLAYRLTPKWSAGYPQIDIHRTYRAVTERFEWGGAEQTPTPYFDHTNGKMLSYQRRMIISLAASMIEEAQRDSTVRREYAERVIGLLEIVERNLPVEAYPFTAYLKDYVPYHEGVEMAEVYASLSELLGDGRYKIKALDMLREIVCRSAEYFRYYHSLGDRSKYLTHNTSLMARNFYMGVDSYEKIAGDVEVLKAMPELRGIDLTAAKCNWTRYYLRQTLLSDARPLSRYHSLTETQQLSQPYSLRISDSTAETRLKQYLENGGAIEDLLDYAEFSEFPFTKYLEQ